MKNCVATSENGNRILECNKIFQVKELWRLSDIYRNGNEPDYGSHNKSYSLILDFECNDGLTPTATLSCSI